MAHHNTYPPSDCLLSEAEDDKHATVKATLLAAGADITGLSVFMRFLQWKAVGMLMLDRDLLRLERLSVIIPRFDFSLFRQFLISRDSVMSTTTLLCEQFLSRLQERHNDWTSPLLRSCI